MHGGGGAACAVSQPELSESRAAEWGSIRTDSATLQPGEFMVLDYTQQGGLLSDEREIFNNLSLQCADLWGGGGGYKNDL